MTACGTLWLEAQNAPDTYLFLRYETCSNLGMAVAVFLFLKSAASGLLDRRGSWLASVSATTYGVYLCHQLIRKHFALEGWGVARLVKEFDSPAAGLLAEAAAVYVCSLALVLTLKCIPYVRRTVS